MVTTAKKYKTPYSGICCC